MTRPIESDGLEYHQNNENESVVLTRCPVCGMEFNKRVERPQHFLNECDSDAFNLGDAD